MIEPKMAFIAMKKNDKGGYLKDRSRESMILSLTQGLMYNDSY